MRRRPAAEVTGVEGADCGALAPGCEYAARAAAAASWYAPPMDSV